jgi:superfamily II DNA or RNA helicase
MIMYQESHECVQAIRGKDCHITPNPLVKVTLKSDIRMGKWVGKTVEEELRRRLTFTNPEWEERVKRGFSTWNIPEKLCFLNDDGHNLIMPRGFIRHLLRILKQHNANYQLDDLRRTLPPVDFSFRGKLRDYQAEAVEAMLFQEFGTLHAPTGSGKTAMALALVAERRQPTLIAVHTKELLEQWVDRIETFLGIPAQEVGIIGAGKKRIGDKITVALFQSLYKCVDKVMPHIGFLIVDECHKIPSRTFTQAVKAFDCRYMLGLSATPYRRDKLTRLIYWHLGDKVHEVNREVLVEEGHILEADVIWRETYFQPYFDPSEEYSKMLTELTANPQRNALIADDVAQEASNGGGVCLVLSDRKEHCNELIGFLARRGVRASLLTGAMPQKDRQAVVEDLNTGKVKVLVATGQLIGEGFDCKALSTLFVATPIKFGGRLLQYLGRVLRPAPGKDKARVYDYVDPVGVLEAAAEARRRVYALQGQRTQAGQG